jgi:hypothetical protein
MIDPNAKRMRVALERIAEDRWCSGDDLRDVAREALGLPVDTDDTRAPHTGPAPDTAAISVTLKRAYEGRALDILAIATPFWKLGP